MKKFLPLIVLLLVFSSGCTVPILNIQIPGLPDLPGFGPTVVQHEHDILVIKSFEAVPDEIDAGQTSKLVAYIQNVGDATIPNVHVDLYDYCEGLFTPRVLTCGPEQRAVTLGTQGDTECDIARILPGEIVPIIWSVCQNRADPVKVRTVCPPDGMKMSVKYKYTTTSITTVSLMSLSEMQRELIERTYTTTESYIALGQGPIKPIITVEDKQPVPVFTVNPGDSPLTNPNVPDSRTVLKLQLKNMGSGRLETKTDGILGISGKNIKITGIGSNYDLKPIDPDVKGDANEEDITCLFAPNGEGVKGNENKWDKEVVRLIGKESSPYFCRIDLSTLKDKVSSRTTRQVTVTVKDYEYMLTKNVFLTISPKILA